MLCGGCSVLWVQRGAYGGCSGRQRTAVQHTLAGRGAAGAADGVRSAAYGVRSAAYGGRSAAYAAQRTAGAAQRTEGGRSVRRAQRSVRRAGAAYGGEGGRMEVLNAVHKPSLLL